MKFQIISQENIQKSPEAKHRFSEWVDLCDTFSDKSDHLLVQCFMQLEIWTYWPYSQTPFKAHILRDRMQLQVGSFHTEAVKKLA